jgi:hypothetical protein
MAKDLTVSVDDRPGSFADLGEAMGREGVNIEGICGFRSGGRAEIHLLVEFAAPARHALEEAGLEVAGERDVIVHEIEDRPGAAGEAARRVADAGVNLELIYLATNTRLVIGADDLEQARAAL